MDTPADLVTPMSVSIFLCLAFAVSAWWFWWPAAGRIERWRISGALRGDLPEAVVFDDVPLPGTQDTRSVDHVVVHKTGVYVVQTVTMHGQIYGGERQAFWGVRRRSVRRRFANPLWDCRDDCRLLADRIDISLAAVIPIVVFLPGARMPPRVPEGIFRGLGFIDRIASDTSMRLSADEVSAVTRALTARALSGVWPERRSRLE